MQSTNTQYLTVLRAKHEELEQAIEQEYLRPAPNGVTVQMLKRQKLRIKDKIARMMPH